jgi:hypothetical protein
MAMNRVMANILSDRLAETRDLSVEPLGFQVDFDEDRYTHLSVPGSRAPEVAVWRRDHELIPEAYRQRPVGTILTVVDAVHERASKMGVTVVAPPRDQFYGRCGCLALDPAGLLVDISSPI